jgi:hypothetical protein
MAFILSVIKAIVLFMVVTFQPINRRCQASRSGSSLGVCSVSSTGCNCSCDRGQSVAQSEVEKAATRGSACALSGAK